MHEPGRVRERGGDPDGRGTRYVEGRTVVRKSRTTSTSEAFLDLDMVWGGRREAQ